MRGRSAFVVMAVLLLSTVVVAPATADADEPDDPTAARQAITRAYEDWAALSTAEEVEGNLDLIDDPRGVVEAARQAEQNFPYEVSHDGNEVSDIRFTSPTEADVTYDIIIDNGLSFRDRVGQAVFRDQRWKLTRATVCGNLALAGGTCAFPADSEAERAIIELFDSIAALTTAEDVAAHLDLIDDPRGVVEAARQAYENFPYEVTHDTNRVADIRFRSDTDAVVTYDTVVDRGPSFLGRTGYAVFTDGRWKITRQTACESLALAGGNCDGSEPLLVVPPGGESRTIMGTAPPAIATRETPRFTG